MNFRTKIWMLPLSAAVVFIIGVALSYAVSVHTSATLERLRSVESPHQALVAQVDRSIEQFKLTLQSATAEGDETKLKDLEGLVADTRALLAQMKRLDGKADVVEKLSAAFDAYHGPALGAAQAMLTKGNPGDQIQRMQTALGKLLELLEQSKNEAARGVAAAQDSVAAGVKRGVAIGLVTGGVVLLVLGLASRMIISSVWRDLGDEPARLRALMQRIAEGDLSAAAEATASTAHAGSLRAATESMARQLGGIVNQIRRASDSIANASGEIAAGNQHLSTRTESTAANLQQTAQAMAQFTSTVRHSKESAHHANELAHAASEAAERGGTIVAEVVSSMDQISTASKKINDIIGTIDSIAFQTNILALNAAVEAARAGEQGRGFAVVASEVRSLAKRSADAAKEIKLLIQLSSEEVESGARLVQDAGSAMHDIVTGVRRVTDIVQQISSASGDQVHDIDRVSVSVRELDAMTQQNAALVEESASAADSLRDQAELLASAVSAFRSSGMSV